MNYIEPGKRGEYAALEYLLKQGYVYRDRNFRAAKREIDLIVMDGDTLVFVEVKARMEANTARGARLLPRQSSETLLRPHKYTP